MKLSHQLVVSSLAVFVLSACSGSASQRRQAKDDFEYLDTPPLTEWKSVEGAEPRFYPDYNIPQGEFSGGIGREVDIRAPQQILELIPGARAERKQGETTLWLLRENELDKVWQTALTMLEERKITLREQTDTRAETGWVTWTQEDEDIVIGSRYVIERMVASGRHGFKISLVDWREDGRVTPVRATNQERYTALMTNLVTVRYDQELRQEAERKAEQLVKRIPISLGSDRSGFPIIIARTPFDEMWRRMPTLLPKIGFTIEERNQSQGTIKAKHASQSDDYWNEIGVKPLRLDSGTYSFLLGDLGNRTSINITDSNGKPIPVERLEDIAPVIAVVAEQLINEQ